MANPDGLTETNVRKLSLKELAVQVIDRHALVDVLFSGSLSPIQDSARQQVLAQLEAHPTVQRAFVNRFDADGTMVVTLAIRDVGTGELLIPTERFNQASLDDYAALLGIIAGAP